MVYKSTIPGAADIPNQSQSQIKENFTQLNTQFGTEHTAFDSATNNGKHKFVTLPVGAGIIPAGTDFALSVGPTISGNQYLQCNIAAQVQGVPLVVNVGGVLAAGTHTIYNFATIPLVPQMGTLLVMDSATGSKLVFTMFTWQGGVLSVPGPSNQLTSGSTFDTFSSGGSTLRLNNATGGNVAFYLKITGSAI